MLAKGRTPPLGGLGDEAQLKRGLDFMRAGG